MTGRAANDRLTCARIRQIHRRDAERRVRIESSGVIE
jgi:hypothetical protein